MVERDEGGSSLSFVSSRLVLVSVLTGWRLVFLDVFLLFHASITIGRWVYVIEFSYALI